MLIDFWAAWCGPCRAALPHMQEIARKFEGQPLVILSVSLDDDEQAWKDFIAKNRMTWLNYRDGGFTGPLSKESGVEAIPHAFTLDADGVLQDEHIGDALIEGKLKSCWRSRGTWSKRRKRRTKPRSGPRRGLGLARLVFVKGRNFSRDPWH